MQLQQTIAVKNTNQSDRKTKINLARLQFNVFFINPVVVPAKVDESY